MQASLQSHLSQVAGAAPPAQQQATAQAALAAPVAPAAPVAREAAEARPAQVSAAAEAMRGALGGFRDAMGTGHAELDETFHAQHKALVALLRAYPLGSDAALEEMAAVQLLQPPVAPVQQQQQD